MAKWLDCSAGALDRDGAHAVPALDEVPDVAAWLAGRRLVGGAPG